MYKRNYASSVGCSIREKYEIGEIKNIDDFTEVLNKCVI